MRDLVVGTGLAGLYKAFKLLKNGHDVKVKELNKMTH
jgi:monoamine oxidase